MKINCSSLPPVRQPVSIIKGTVAGEPIEIRVRRLNKVELLSVAAYARDMAIRMEDAPPTITIDEGDGRIVTDLAHVSESCAIFVQSVLMAQSPLDEKDAYTEAEIVQIMAYPDGANAFIEAHNYAFSGDLDDAPGNSTTTSECSENASLSAPESSS